jgi:hypothetical protein
MEGITIYRITGVSPLLMNNPEAMGQGNEGLGTKKIPTPEEEAAAKVYRLESGQLYVPAVAFRSSIIGKGGGASGRKIGKMTANARVAAGVFTVETKCPLIHPKTGKPIKEYQINIMRAVVQNNGVRRARPEVPEWACDLALEIDTDFISPELVLELLNISGKVAGVGDYRPQKKGPFGRFKAEIRK